MQMRTIAILIERLATRWLANVNPFELMMIITHSSLTIFYECIGSQVASEYGNRQQQQTYIHADTLTYSVYTHTPRLTLHTQRSLHRQFMVWALAVCSRCLQHSKQTHCAVFSRALTREQLRRMGYRYFQLTKQKKTFTALIARTTHQL